MNTIIENIIAIVEKNITKIESGALLFGKGGFYGDDLKNISIEFYSPLAFIVLYQEESENFINLLAQNLLSQPKIEGIIIQNRFKRPYSLVGIWGNVPEKHIARENGLSYHLSTLTNAQNIGFFPDIKEGRAWTQRNSKGKRVLNLFAYTCAFSVAALEGGAEFVLNADMNKNSLNIGRENHKLNNHDLKKVEFFGHNILKSIGKLMKKGPYDLVIIDPPPNQKGSFKLERDYPKIVRRLPEMMRPGGEILSCLNSSFHSRLWFKNMLKETIPGLKIKEELPNAADYPETEPDKGLKIVVCKI